MPARRRRDHGEHQAPPLRVLVLDEDASAGAARREALERAGYAVEWVRSFVAAAAALGRGPLNAVILSASGPEFARNTFLAEAHQTAAALPIIVMTGHPSDEQRDALTRLGATRVLAADGPPAEVVTALAEVLGSSSGAS